MWRRLLLLSALWLVAMADLEAAFLAKLDLARRPKPPPGLDLAAVRRRLAALAGSDGTRTVRTLFINASRQNDRWTLPLPLESISADDTQDAPLHAILSVTCALPPHSTVRANLYETLPYPQADRRESATLPKSDGRVSVTHSNTSGHLSVIHPHSDGRESVTGGRKSGSDSRERTLIRLLDTKLVTTTNGSRTILEFELERSLLKKWSNLGLAPRVELHFIRVETIREDDRDLIQLLVNPADQPMLSVYYANKRARRKRDAQQVARDSRITHHVRHRTHGRTRRSRTHRHRHDRRRRKLARERIWRAQLCQRRPLHISFAQLEWDDWVVAPKGYDAFYCSGTCRWGSGAHRSSSNHAIVQALYNSVSHKLAPEPCCVPTKLSPQSLLYYDEKNSVVHKVYDDMVVDECGCV